MLAAMGALTHGNVRVSLTRDTTEAEVEAFCAALPEVVAEIRRGRPGCDRSSTAAGCPARARSSSWPSCSPRSRSATSVAVVSDDPAARYDVPAWCRMREQEYVGEDLADDGVPRYLVRRTHVRKGATDDAASPPYEWSSRPRNCSAVNV